MAENKTKPLMQASKAKLPCPLYQRFWIVLKDGLIRYVFNHAKLAG